MYLSIFAFQGVTSTYDTDFFTQLMSFIQSKAAQSLSRSILPYEGFYVPYKFAESRTSPNTSGDEQNSDTFHTSLWNKLFSTVSLVDVSYFFNK